ncbi:MAG: VCBS repeat-containing protein, partial [Acidobacteria bacterium]|nr:VCBS repeat-containing protein [Acidobacteriota bacterium]
PFRKALALAPDSVRERINYGLSLLRAGDLDSGLAELRKAQSQDPSSPYTWFNIAVTLKRQGDLDGALTQFRGMEKLVPGDPITHYQIGSILKAQGHLEDATREFEAARRLDPLLTAPHFQLYGLYRQANRAQDAAAELNLFRDLKKQQEGAAVPEDMEWNVYAEIDDPIDAPAPPPLPEPVYRAERIAGGFTGGSPGVAAIVLDGGVRPSLLAWSSGRVALYRNGRVPVADSGLEALRDVVSIAPGDFDNDGLPDLCVVTTHGAALYRNVNGKFQKQSDLAAGSFREAVWLDFDHDYDLDLFLLGDDARLLRNNGAAGFSDETRRFPFVAGRALSATRFDLEPDTPGFDLVVSYQDRPGVLYRDRLAGTYEAVPLPRLPAGATHLAAADFNRDGRTDLAAAPALLLLNRPAGFEPSTPAPDSGAHAFADFDGDGRLARASIAANGDLRIERDTSAGYGNWIEIGLTGVKNLKTAVGAKVEVRAGPVYSKQLYQGVPLVFRLGPRKEIDTVRVTWPNGLIQNELAQAPGRVTPITEAPRMSGSCPMIFTWDGERFHFITDVLGVAPLGASSGDGRYFPVDHDEYVSIPGELVRPRDGAYPVRITEELHEVSYLDQVSLLALDHPAATEVVTNEKFKSPPFPEFRLYGGEHRVYPVAARDTRGRDVLPALLHRDSTYPDAFRRDSAGVAETHHLDLDFGRAAPSNRAVLVLNGWVDWADGSTFLSAMQERKDLTFPYLQVKDAAGNWKTVVEDMGMPSGKPKTMAVDLTGKFLSASREVRIVTNLCVYWDEIYLFESAAPPAARLTAAPLLSAGLHFRGFSKVTIHPQRKQPERFDYQSVSDTSMWNPTPGNYTRYGDVADLLRAPDDRMLIMGSGDEVALRFDSRALPPLPDGWKRDFLLLVDGWAKDADANTAYSQTVAPLPFHGMSSYPYPAGEHYPDDPAHREYQRLYNTRPALRLIGPLHPRSE